MDALTLDDPQFPQETLKELRMSGPVRWFTFRDREGKLWDVYATSHSDSPEMKGPPGTLGYDGLTDPETGNVLIDAASPRVVQDYITLHEVMHASLDGAGGVSSQAEEDVITKMAPRLYPILRKFGLRWPPRSDEVKAFERSVRRRK